MSRENLIRVIENFKTKMVSCETFEGDEKIVFDKLISCLEQNMHNCFYIDYDFIGKRITISIRYLKESNPNGYFFSQYRYEFNFFLQTVDEIIKQVLNENHKDYISKC